MFEVVYRQRARLDNWRVIDTQKRVVLRRAWIANGLLYGYIGEYTTVCISGDMIDSIFRDGYPVEVEESFKTGDFVQYLPF